ncbi:uberolysin/carnocyclin family circular bacteriocin [Staphylococcus simulans]|uniref:uberolysin/carnocyclin family circular bacteriocin n=1 Tax=Staphylococcus simulans TaxID=1286 RepID=UPI001E373EEF|nr:uberolysin/carnocyclin family circular bacteriocin [Staphylococcus simulans]MCD8915294.1 uberolysin/carnocyclin family circular bacteriocin [Staphylococcus simulans]
MVLSSKKVVFVLLLSMISALSFIYLSISIPELASTLGVSSYAAKKAIDIIAAAGDVMAIIGLIGVVTGAGAIGAGLLWTAKRLIVKYGKKYAAAW